MESNNFENIRAALEMGQPCRCNGHFVCTRCKGLAALDALELEPKLNGVGLIAQERTRQVNQEGWTQEHDGQHTCGELAMVACYYAMPCWPEKAESLFPPLWDDAGKKRQGNRFQPTMRDLVKSGALIAAEIDRRLAAGEEA